ncbi:hypothetical protein ABIF93_005790 [Bradyrhizobium japonicum]
MSVSSFERRFPSRQYPYRRSGDRPTQSSVGEPLGDLPPNSIVRFFLGSDEVPHVLTDEEVRADLNDPFARIVFHEGHRPQTLREILDLLNAADGADAVPEQRLYRVADGGQIAWSQETEKLDRHLRIVITRHRAGEAELFISTTGPFSSSSAFLQVFAWDDVARAFNFYERRHGIWSWAGSSWQALERPTRGLGPFDSHVNGGPVMKELKAPWMHWHSQSSQIRHDILSPDDPLRTDPLYNGNDLKMGEDLELIVRAGTARWTEARFRRHLLPGRLERAEEFLRHLLTTTTINITSSQQESGTLDASDPLRLPTTFFIASDLLLDELAIPASISKPKTQASFYLDALKRHGVKLKDGSFQLDSDVHFAFAVPEQAFEDRLVVRALLSNNVLSRKQAACLLMVDFPNPIYSQRREMLLRYVPASIASDGGAEFDKSFFASIRDSTAASEAASPEAEILGLYSQPDDGWETVFARRIEDYWKALQARLQTEDGFDDLFRLSESRRRQFRKSPLAEFGLTLPCATAIKLSGFLKMNSTAHVVAD